MLTVSRITGMCLALTIAAAATADGFLQIPPTPDSNFVGEGAVDPIYTEGTIVPGPVVHYDTAPIQLFSGVKYTAKRKAHPCAVTKIIKVNDPCGRKDSCCGPDCVYIEICVPPDYCEEKVRCRRHGDRLRYDYGKYKVDVRVKKSHIVVDYKR